MKAKPHYAWYILLVIFIGLLATQGLRMSFGNFIQPWQLQFQTDRKMLSLVSMVSFILYGVTQPFFGKLTDRFGVRNILAFNTLLIGLTTIATSFVTSPWQLMILYGIISSIGFGGTSGTVAAVAVTNWFTKNRGLAFGLIEAGFGAGQMVIVPSSLFLIDAVGWRPAVVLMGALLCLVVFPLLLLFLRDRPGEKGLRAYGEEQTSADVAEQPTSSAKVAFLDIAKTRAFWCLVVPFFVCGFTTSGLMDTHLVPYCGDQGFSTAVTGAAVSLLAAFNILGTLLSGKLADIWSCRKMLASLYGLRSLTMLILLTTNQTGWLMVFSIVFGFVDFATQAPSQLLVTQYFRNYSVGLILGWLSLSHQLGSAVGAYVPGVLYSTVGGYHISFVTAIVLLIAATMISLWLPEPDATRKTPRTIKTAPPAA